MRNGFPAFFKLMDRQEIMALSDQGVTSLTNFVTGIILARACGKEQLGLYVLGFSLVLFIMAIQDSLILSPFTVYSPRLRGIDLARYCGSTLIHQWVFSALAMLCLSIAGLLVASGLGPQQFAPVLWAIVIAITFMLLREYARRICFARLQMKAALILDSGVCVVQIGGLFLLSHLGTLSAMKAYWVTAFACGLAGIGWLIWIRKHYSVDLRRSLSDLTQNWSFGKWLIGGSLAYMGAVQSYPWLLAVFHGPSSTGILAACLAIVSLANPFIIGMSNIFSPKMAHAYTQGVAELHRVVVKAAILLAGCVGMFCLAILIFGDQILMLAYGGAYIGNRIALSVLGLTTFITALSTPFGYGLRALDRPDVTFKNNSIQLGVAVTVGVWLAKAYGIPGVACALLLASLVGGIVTYVYYIVQVRFAEFEGLRVETTPH